jgi:hypothetical protein
MHDDAQNKRTTKSKRGFFQAVTYTNIEIPKEDHGRMLLCTPMMSITNSVPSIFTTLTPLLLKSTNLNFRITHSSKQTSKNNNYKGTFLYF